MGKYDRLDEYNYRKIVLPMSHGEGVTEYHVTSCISLAFLKADSENMCALFKAFPFVCMDTFTYYNWDVPCCKSIHYAIRALDNIGMQTGAFLFTVSMYGELLRHLDWSSETICTECLARDAMGMERYWKDRREKEAQDGNK